MNIGLMYMTKLKNLEIKNRIKTIYRGHEFEDSNTIHAVMQTPSMDVLQQHMENEAELVAEAVGDPSPEANLQ